MSHIVRPILALYFLAATAYQVKCGDALFTALNAACATYWLMTWVEKK